MKKFNFELQRFATINVEGEFENSYDEIYIVGSAGDDYIYNNGSGVTIEGGGGDDEIDFGYMDGFYVYRYADGDDTINNFSGTLIIDEDNITGIEIGDEYFFRFYMDSGGSITFFNSMYIYLEQTENEVSIEENAFYLGFSEVSVSVNTSEILLNTGDGNDDTVFIGEGVSEVTVTGGYEGGETSLYIESQGFGNVYQYGGGYMTISGFTPDDTLDLGEMETVASYYFNDDGSVEIFMDYGSIFLPDYAYNYGDEEESGGVSINLLYQGELIETVITDIDNQYIDGTSYADDFSYLGYHESVTIDALAGNDTIVGRFWYSSLSGGDGNDVIDISEGDVDNATINPGAGNDTVYMDNYDGWNYYEYYTGDGNDVIFYAKKYDTIFIDDGEGSYSTMWSGSDFVIKVDSGAITLKNMNASLLPEIEGFYDDEEEE